MEPPIPYSTLQSWKPTIRASPTPFITAIPKVELHVHLEGTLTPELRFKFAKRNGIVLSSARLGKTFETLEELREAYGLLAPRSVKGKGVSAFFEAYYGGMESLITEADFYELALSYFERAKGMNVTYCEVLFDIQAHTRRGVAVETVMNGLRRARGDAKADFDLSANFIACFLRDLSPASALEHYTLLLPHRDIIVGIGLDSNEFDRPPVLFEKLYVRARKDGFRLTAHCDVKQPATLEHVRQVVEVLGGDGAERVDHGLDAAEKPELVRLIKEKGVGMTIFIPIINRTPQPYKALPSLTKAQGPWAYVRHHTEADLFSHIRTLMDAGIQICISSDSPAYVESNWLTDNLELLMLRGGWTDEDVVRVQKDAVEMCWATEEEKLRLRGKLDEFLRTVGS